MNVNNITIENYPSPDHNFFTDIASHGLMNDRLVNYGTFKLSDRANAVNLIDHDISMRQQYLPYS